MLPRVPGTSNVFILPFTPTEAFADEEDPFKVLVLSRTMFGVVVVDVANKMNPYRGCPGHADVALCRGQTARRHN